MPVLVHAERVGVGGVDDRDAGVERRVDGGDGPGPVRSTFDRERHLTEADGADHAVTDGALLHVRPPAPCRRTPCRRASAASIPSTTRPGGVQSGTERYGATKQQPRCTGPAPREGCFVRSSSPFVRMIRHTATGKRGRGRASNRGGTRWFRGGSSAQSLRAAWLPDSPWPWAPRVRRTEPGRRTAEVQRLYQTELSLNGQSPDPLQALLGYSRAVLAAQAPKAAPPVVVAAAPSGSAPVVQRPPRSAGPAPAPCRWPAPRPRLHQRWRPPR